MTYILAMAIGVAVPAYAKTYTVEIYATETTYTQSIATGVTLFKRSDVSKRNLKMGFSGTSVCQVIDTYDMDVDGYFTFQFKSLMGVTDVPVSGTSVSVHWRGSDIDSDAAWLDATKNTIINGINAFSGITDVGYDINDITGVTAFKYMRLEFESGIAASTGGAGNIRPVGVLHIR